MISDFKLRKYVVGNLMES